MNYEEKPQWMTDHEASDRQQFASIRNELADIRHIVGNMAHSQQFLATKEDIHPIMQDYVAAGKLGKWALATVMFISFSIGIVLGIINILKNLHGHS